MDTKNAEPTNRIVTFYRFVELTDYRELRDALRQKCRELGILGTILLAEEGINATICAAPESLDALFAHFDRDPRLAGMERKVSRQGERRPFKRLKVRLKKEIVTLGAGEVDPRRRVGTYLTPREWNELLEKEELRLIDTRNLYETKLGTFEGAEAPPILRFRDFPRWVEANLDPERDKRVALFCTGGIRCEKATSYLLSKGFSEVYHLQGGILRYLEETDRTNSRWNGECFVFDNRVSVDHSLEEGNRSMKEVEALKQAAENRLA